MMSFDTAKRCMLLGMKVSRQGWDAKGQFLFMVVGNHWNFDSDVSGIDDLETCSFICMKTTDDKLTPWFAELLDTAANDWVVLEDE